MTSQPAQPQDPLAQLRDIHLPDPIGWWPPAPGWWIVAILAITLVFTGCYLLYMHRRRNRYRVAALNELKQQFSDFQQHKQQQQLCHQVLAILRRCLLNTEAIATNCSASELLHRLNRQAGKALFSDQLATRMDGLIYAPHPEPFSDSDLADLQKATRQWIRRHRYRGRTG